MQHALAAGDPSHGVGELLDAELDRGTFDGHSSIRVDKTLNNERDRLVFDDGSLLIDHKAAKTDADFDPATCVTRLVETGTYTVVGGSGAYRHAQGHGTYETHLLAHGCSQDKPPTTYLLTIEASGPLSV